MTGADALQPGMFVQARGTNRSVTAGAAGGVVGAFLADRKKHAGHRGVRDTNYLYFGPAALTVYRAKQRLLRGGFAATDEVVAAAPRENVTAVARKHGLRGWVTISFADGTAWEFDVPKRRENRSGEAALDLLAATVATERG